MPLFFFDTDDGTHLMRDELGVELPDEQAARDQGSKALGELAKEYIPGADPQKNITMWIRDERGDALMQLSISFAIQALK